MTKTTATQEKKSAYASVMAHSKYSRLADKLSYMPGVHVVESELFSGVSYVMQGDDIAIITALNGQITMPYADFRKLFKEAFEVFDLWDDVIKDQVRSNRISAKIVRFTPPESDEDDNYVEN